MAEFDPEDGAQWIRLTLGITSGERAVRCKYLPSKGIKEWEWSPAS
jgi:hypothetical protein